MRKTRHDTKGVLDETKFSYYHPADANEREYGPYVPVLLRWFNSYPMLTHYVAALYFCIGFFINVLIGMALSDQVVMYIIIQLVVGSGMGYLVMYIYQITKIKKDNK